MCFQVKSTERDAPDFSQTLSLLPQFFEPFFKLLPTMNSRPSALSPPLVMSFAASDPTGGAGVQADLMTISSMGCHALSVITALTVQDTVGVDSVLAIDSEWVEDQARTLLEDMPVDAFKIGLLGSVENIEVIAGILSDYPNVPVVLDPVLASGRGDELADEEMISALKSLLLPRITLLTPNSLEARRLAEKHGEEDHLPLETCAHRLLDLGCEYVLLTGTHENTAQVFNDLFGKSPLGSGSVFSVIRHDTWERLAGSYHGSGCTLASAVAAGLAHGLDISSAVKEAQEFTWRALASGFRPGMGQFIPDRFFWARGTEGGSGNA